MRAFLFDQFSVFAQRALHADEVLLHVFAVRITAAGGEFSIAPVTDHQVVLATLWALLIERDVWNFLALVETASGLTIRISGTRHELAEAPTFQDHHPAAVFAIFFLRSFLHIGRIEVG